MSTKTHNNFTGIFCDHGPKSWQTHTHGALINKRLAVKDVFAVKGERNSAGNPNWFKAAKPAQQTASAVNKLMNEGCSFTGFTHTDELAYSLEGNNIHYGAAQNPKLSGHASGGSSMGSAAAVAANLADIGLGTDTGGSIRIPASYCGLFGIRPSHNVIEKDGLIPLAPPFDTIGWLTQSAELLSDVGNVLLPNQTINNVDTLVICEPLFELVSPALQTPIKQLLEKTKPYFKHHKEFELPNSNLLSELADSFRILQGRAIGKTHKDWLQLPGQLPQFAPAIAARFKMALALTAQEEQEALKVQTQWQTLITKNLNTKSCLFLPTTPTTAPKLGTNTSALRMQIITLSAIAGLSRSAQVHLPLANLENGHPYGFSLMMSHSNDKSLLACVQQLAAHFKQDTPA
ncbi:amidase family protein [Pseudoalteromonas carrageenovora]|uniref:amidase family protein n=1 Tax=Pseudoalteromonas carrageenovora TaxID=227 RepID=UPI0026E241F8|nr:amidase family protein [Pseudoalteromonas carrageenovora]MDO6547067.1 amidase family protein [Pseudoalteromonas carrageenovora]MDO6831515.1 amidase family protein [Pseudoalteromonas carrageenovora]